MEIIISNLGKYINYNKKKLHVDTHELSETSLLFLPWICTNYSVNKVSTLVKLAKIVRSNSLKIFSRRYLKKSALLILSNVKHDYSNFTISNVRKEKHKCNKYLNIILEFFLHDVISQLESLGFSQNISFDCNAYIHPGHLHVNGGCDEFCHRNGLHVQVNDDGTVNVAEQCFEYNHTSKTTFINFLKVWPQNSIGFVSRRICDSLYLVHLTDDEESLRSFQCLEQLNITSLPLSFGLWQWSIDSKIRVCSDSMTFNRSRCAFCKEIVFNYKCICQSVENSVLVPRYRLSFNGTEVIHLKFMPHQVVLYDEGVVESFKGTGKRKYKRLVVDSISGLFLNLRTLNIKNNSATRFLRVHFLDPNLRVPIFGEGTLDTLFFYESNNYEGIKKSSIMRPVNLICSLCLKGPKCDKPCNVCGGVRVGYNVQIDKARQKHDGFQSLTQSFTHHIRCFHSLFHNIFLDNRDSCTFSSYQDAMIIFNHLKSCIQADKGIFTITYNSFEAVLMRCDDDYCAFFELYDECIKLEKQVKGCIDLLHSNFHQNLSSWVSKNSVLAHKTRKKSDGCLILNTLETLTTHYHLHDPYFPFFNFSVPDVLNAQKHVLKYKLMGEDYFIKCVISSEIFFQVCKCTCQTMSYNFSHSVDYSNDSQRTGCYCCYGPYIGLSIERKLDFDRLLTFMCEKYSRDCEIHASFFFLSRIHRLFDDYNTNKQVIFILYVFCMYMWYADKPERQYEISDIKRARREGDPYAIVDFMYRHRSDDELHMTYLQMWDQMIEQRKDSPVVSVKMCSWYSRFRSAPYLSFVRSFFSSQQPVYDGPIVKKKKTNVCDYFQFSDEELEKLLKSSIEFVDDCLPFTHIKKYQSIDENYASITPKDVINKYFNCEKFDENFLYNLQENLWFNFIALCSSDDVCRYECDFLKILRDYSISKQIAFTPCPNNKCSQCRALNLLKQHSDGNPTNLRALKKFIPNCARQLKIFGCVVNFEICEHNQLFHTCLICKGMYSECRKNDHCVCIDEKPVCKKRDVVYLHMKDGSSVAFEEPDNDCRFLRFCRDWMSIHGCVFPIDVCVQCDLFMKPSTDNVFVQC